MSTMYHGPILSTGKFTQQDRDTLNRRLNSLVDNGPGYIRLTRDSGERINPQGGAVLSSGNFQSVYRSDVGNHVAVLLSATAHDAAPSTTNSVMLVQDAGVSVNTSLYILGTGKRIVGDFNNATASQRTLFQAASSGNTIVGAIPNGAGTVGAFNAYGAANPDATSFVQLNCNLGAGIVTLASSRTGAGLFLPIVVQTNGATQLTIDTAGLVTATQNLAWNSGQAFSGTLDHANTANRVYTFPDADGTVLLAVAPTFSTGTAYALTTAYANTGASLVLGVGTWLLLGYVSWLPTGAGDVGSVGQQRFATTAGVLAQMGGAYTFTAAAARAQTVQIGTLTVAAGTATLTLQAQKNVGTGTSTADTFGVLSVKIG